MTTISALLLAGLFYATEPAAKMNEAVFNKRAILAAVEDYLPKPLKQMSDQEVQDLFAQQVEQEVLNMDGELVDGVVAEKVDLAKERKKPEEEIRLPFFIYSSPDGQKFYIMSVRGNGLWDEIWGNVSLKEDLVTVAGASFDHKAETPGLGAEIKDNPTFFNQFKGKKIYDADGEFTSVVVRKGGARDLEHEVDGISGATITSDGVTDMLKKWIQYYGPYLDKLKEEGTQTGMILEN